MGGPLLKIAIVVAMVHGLRALGRRAGPRWGGLVLGLPCTSAVALVSCEVDRGTLVAQSMADASLLGLAAAVSLPLAFAAMIGRGISLSASAATAVLAYLAVAAGLSTLPDAGPWPSLALATLAVLAACRLSRVGGIAVEVPTCTRVPRPARVLVLRSAVPAGVLAVVFTLRDAAGAGWAGLLGTFPGLSLTSLVVTHLEEGPGAASRMARALPQGNLSMVAFLAVFRLGGPTLGLVAVTVLGYVAALAVLLMGGVSRRRRRFGGQIPAIARSARPALRFAPRFEAMRF